MKCKWIIRVGAVAMTATLLCGSFEYLTVADDWPMLGRDGTRNGVSAEIAAPVEWTVESREGDRVIRESRGIRWSAPLGSETHSSPVVSNGLVWIGTNSDRPGVESGEEVHSVLKCFRVADGKQVYEYDSPKLGSRVHDPGWTGLGSSPLIEGDRLWLTTNRSEVLCLDIGPLILGEGTPRELWKLDLIETFDISPHVPLMGPPRPCSIGPSWNDRIFVTTNNGVGEDYTTVSKPDAPNLVCLNKETGEVYWKDNSPGSNVLLTQFASPTVTAIRGRVQVIVPQSDGWVRAFDPMTGEKLWEFDINFKVADYAFPGSRNLLLGNAVVHEDRVYLASGRDAEQGEGEGRLVCIDPTKRGDVSSELAVDAAGQPLPRRRTQAIDPKVGEKAIANPNSALVWEFVNCGNKFEDQMHRTIGSVVVAKGLVIAADFSGLVHCFDAKTGQRYCSHDTFAAIWASPLIVDDKVYVTDEDGDVMILVLSADPVVALANVNGVPQLLREIAMDTSIYSSPVFANGALYLATRTTLFAIDGEKDEPDPEQTGGFWPQWRGPNRDNVSPETGLLKEWPAAGPPLVWRLKGLGEGISPVSIADGRIFALSNYETTEYVRALDERTGEPLWSALLGASQRQSPLMRWLTQRPVTLDGDRLYAMSLLGELVCLQSADGKELWRINYPIDFAGEHGVFGYSDCPVVAGDKLLCSPGGSTASIVALDSKTGTVVWKCAVPDGGRAAYGNGIVMTIDGQSHFVASLEKALVGVAVDSGTLLWRLDGAVIGYHHPHTPLVRDHFITTANAFGTGLKLLEVYRAGNTVDVKEVFSMKATAHIADFQDDTVLLGDRLYEPSRGVFSCFNAQTGAVIWQKRMGPPAAVTCADGKFYFHSDGRMSLVEPTAEEPIVKSEFPLPDPQQSLGTTTPVVTGGHLYVREDEQLFCFDVRESAPARKSEPRTIQLEMPTPAAGIASDKDEPDPEQTGGFWPQWRGPNRDNVSAETGLLKDWPEAGPPLVWRVDGVGEGIASVSIADGRIYTLGYFEDGEFLTALDQRTAQRVWATRLGPRVNENPLMRWLSQRSPTLDEDRLYAITTGGRLVCLQTRDGHELWSRNYPDDFASPEPIWGFCDYPFVDGDKLICTPGGPQASVVALDKRTGKELWRSLVPNGGRSAYAALVVAEVGGVRQYIAFLEKTLVGLRASDGRLLWSYGGISNGTANSHTPIVRGDHILTGNGYGTGLALLKLIVQGENVSVEAQYHQRTNLDAFQDSSLVVGDHIYVSTGNLLMCLDWKSGERVWRTRNGRAAVVCADDRLYLRNSDGHVTLADASATEYIERGGFQIPDAVGAAGATCPVIAGGRMYLRDDNKLLCYDIRENALKQPQAAPQMVVLNAPAAATANEGRERTLRSVFVPTPQDVVEKMLELAVVKETDVVYDLGSGDGRIVITAARKYGCRAIGYELDKELVESSRTKADAAGVKSLVTFERKDLFTADLRDADVIAVFLLPQQLEKLLPQLEKMKPGSRLVSHQFEIPGIPADQVAKAESSEDGDQHTLYLWTLPLKKENK